MNPLTSIKQWICIDLFGMSSDYDWETRKRPNNELETQIQNLCPLLMRGVVETLTEDVA